MSPYPYITKICAILAYFFLNLVVMATPFAPLKIQIAYFKSLTPKPYYSQEKILDFLHRTEISEIFNDFCINLVAMATPFDPLKIMIVYFNSSTLRTYYSCKKITILYRTEICAFLAYFLPKFAP